MSDPKSDTPVVLVGAVLPGSKRPMCSLSTRLLDRPTENNRWDEMSKYSSIAGRLNAEQDWIRSLPLRPPGGPYGPREKVVTFLFFMVKKQLTTLGLTSLYIKNFMKRGHLKCPVNSFIY